MVWGTPQTRNSLTSIRELLIDTPDGHQVRLGDVADVRILPTPNLIVREHNSRRIDVSLNAHGRDLGAVVRDVKERLQGVEFPLGYHAEILGEYQERQAAQGQLLGFGIAAALGVFLLLQAAFGQLAPGGSRLLHPAVSPDGRGAGGVRDRRRHLAWFAGGILHGVRGSRAQRHHADQSLSASGARRRRAVRSRARPAGSAGSARTDPDDRPGGGACPGAPGDLRRYPRP